MRGEFLGVSAARWALAVSGLAAGSVALTGAAAASEAAGWCLRAGDASFGHCGWCYLGVALLVSAAAPWPRLAKARVRD